MTALRRPKINPCSPFSHGWHATTALQPWGVSVKRTIVALFGLLVLAGCAVETKIPEEPAMYMNMAQPGAVLDTQAAAIMFSQYRQNNGLGTVVVDPDLVRLAEQQSQAMAARNKMDHDVKAPLGKRLEAGGIPRRSRLKTSPPATTRSRKHFRVGAIHRRTRPTC